MERETKIQFLGSVASASEMTIKTNSLNSLVLIE